MYYTTNIIIVKALGKKCKILEHTGVTLIEDTSRKLDTAKNANQSGVDRNDTEVIDIL